MNTLSDYHKVCRELEKKYTFLDHVSVYLVDGYKFGLNAHIKPGTSTTEVVLFRNECAKYRLNITRFF